MPLLALPEEVIVHVLSFLPPHTIAIVGGACKRLYSIAHFRLVWKTAYQTSDLPLTEPPSIEDGGDAEFDYEGILIRAILLNNNWMSSRPTPKSTNQHSSAVSSVWMLKSRYLIIFSGRELSCWDLDAGDKRLWEYRLTPGVGWADLLETGSVSRTEPQFLFGYTTSHDPNSCQILMSGETLTSPPQMLCNIDTHASIHNFGFSESVVVLVCVDGSLVVARLQTPLEQDTIPLRRETRLHSRSIHQVIVLHDLILLVRGQNRGVAIDAYELCDGTALSTYSEARNSASLSIAQAQLVAISPPRSPSAPTLGNNDLHFQILAALPYSVDHYSLLIHRSTGDTPIHLALELMGDDQTSRRPSFGRVIAEPDGYDSDSRPSRIAQPSQVLDLQLGRSSRRAVAIQISAHTNDRIIWGYSIPKGDGPLVARRLAFSAPGLTTPCGLGRGLAEHPDPTWLELAMDAVAAADEGQKTGDVLQPSGVRFPFYSHNNPLTPSPFHHPSGYATPIPWAETLHKSVRRPETLVKLEYSGWCPCVGFFVQIAL
ncbi:hypothetical protein M407DRAFT_20242 [Tulasnella calospora MUT 4182]|uniref:F-box domain-containing protein n=1 Tax=Tulasnella calospora MUT 4182 TaxID=1051891 RepID=A0A0C3L9X6_9AGAM|nr:hypothetical protein M407DRAFT_20242 [Tulasnella calospora MUT 4182]